MPMELKRPSPDYQETNPGAEESTDDLQFVRIEPRPLGFAFRHAPSDLADSFSPAFRSLTNRWSACRQESRFFQLLKSGMKYARTSRAKSLPVSASKHFHSRIFGNGARLMGKRTCRHSFASLVLRGDPPNLPGQISSRLRRDERCGTAEASGVWMPRDRRFPRGMSGKSPVTDERKIRMPTLILSDPGDTRVTRPRLSNCFMRSRGVDRRSNDWGAVRGSDRYGVRPERSSQLRNIAVNPFTWVWVRNSSTV